MTKSCNAKSLYLLLLLVLALVSPTSLTAQQRHTISREEYSRLIKLRTAVNANMSSLEAHEAFINAWGSDTTILVQYRVWMKRYPKNPVIPFAIGKSLLGGESPEAQSFLLKAVRLKPQLAEAWSLLSIDAGLRGDNILAAKCARKAAEADPGNVKYAFDYASSLRRTEADSRRLLSQPVSENKTLGFVVGGVADTATCYSETFKALKKFPGSTEGAKALYWMAGDETDTTKKIAYYELFKREYRNSKSDWFQTGMMEYYRFMVFKDPHKAAGIAEIDKIPVHKKLADTLIKVNELLYLRKYTEANAFIQPVVLSPNVYLDEPFMLYKAKVADAAGATRAAYDTVVRYYSKTPSDSLQKALFTYAAKIGLGPERVQMNIKQLRDQTAAPADDFSLYNYVTRKNSSLADYRGKVILLTYWFPGCGPCRREMPYFENVLKNFDRNDVVYLGLNLEQSQDALVLPFLQSTGYSFIPLRDSWQRKAGNLQAAGAPTNFIIDQDGRIAFSNFRIDASNEDQLRLMISDLIGVYKRNDKLRDSVAAKQ